MGRLLCGNEPLAHGKPRIVCQHNTTRAPGLYSNLLDEIMSILALCGTPIPYICFRFSSAASVCVNYCIPFLHPYSRVKSSLWSAVLPALRVRSVTAPFERRLAGGPLFWDPRA